MIKLFEKLDPFSKSYSPAKKRRGPESALDKQYTGVIIRVGALEESKLTNIALNVNKRNTTMTQTTQYQIDDAKIRLKN